MPKLNDLGESPFDCLPKYRSWSKGGTQQTLFNPMKEKPRVQPGNPAYEGFGYPAAGYGQKRNTVARLAHRKVPTTYGAAVVGSRITTQGTLNPGSSDYSRATMASFAGLGCQGCTPVDHKMTRQLNGLGQDLTTVQQFANAIVANAVPEALLTKIVNKLVADEQANTKAYAAIQKLKALNPSNPTIPTLQRAQENAWGETNVAKFYALLIPEMQSRLAGRGLTPPDYAHIKSAANPGVFAQVANFVREKVVGDAAKNLIQQKLMVDSSLKGLGALQFAIPIGIALLVAAALIAWMQSSSASAAASAAESQLIAACVSGAIPKDACAAAVTQMKQAEPTNWGNIAMYGAVGVGGLVLLQVISSIRSAFPGK